MDDLLDIGPGYGQNNFTDDCMNLDLMSMCNLHGLKIINYNIGGLSSNFDLIEILLNAKDKEKRVDILNVNETWLSSNSLKNDLKIAGYKYVRMDRVNINKTKGGGFIIYYADHLNIDFDCYKDKRISNDYFEFLPYKIKCKESRDILMCFFYKPPDGSHKNLSHIADFLENVQGNMSVILAGDSNIDQTKNSKPRDEFQSLCHNYNLTITNTSIPTHFRKDSNSVIDLICCSSDMHVQTGILNFTSNNDYGHLPTFLIYDCIPDTLSNTTKFCSRNLRNFNETEYVRDLKESDWAPFFNNVDPSYCWDYFTGIITQTLDKKYPLKNHKKKVLNTSWLDNEALDIIGQRNRLFKKARRSGRDIDWALAKENQSRAKKDSGK